MDKFKGQGNDKARKETVTDVNKDIFFDIYLVLSGKTFRPLDKATFQLTVVNLTSV